MEIPYRNREYNPERDRLVELLIGQKIISVNKFPEPEDGDSAYGYLNLSNGSTLVVSGNEGCGGCGAGWYHLTELNKCDNIITNVEIDEAPAGDGEPCPVCKDKHCCNFDHTGAYRIFVFADNRKINLATFEGDDGNGYYGTGWWLSIISSGIGDLA